MSTKTITIVDPKDYQVGDIFTGTVKYARGNGGAEIEHTVTGPLTSSYMGGALFVLPELPYIIDPDWKNVIVTREADVFHPKTLPAGTIVRHQPLTSHAPGERYVKIGTGGWASLDTGWVALPNSESVSRTIEDPDTFEKWYEIVYQPEEATK